MDIVEFLTSKEIIVVYIIAAVACLLCFIIYLVEKHNDRGRKRHNTKELNKLVEQNKLIIFVGGLGLPYFSTDTISVVGASLSHCDAILKATKTDGIYDKDPNIYLDAKHLDNITYDYALQNNLQIMDDTAFSLAKQLNLPIYIFSLFEDNCFTRALNKEIVLSVVN